MNRKELEKLLSEKSDGEFKEFVKNFGGDHQNRESIVRAFVDDPTLERRLCQLLDQPTEEEKRTRATVDAATSAKRAATSAKRSATAAMISVVIALLAVLFQSCPTSPP